MTVRIASTEEELIQLADVLLQLRPQYNVDTLLMQIKKQQALGYQLAYYMLEDQVACVAGFVINEKLAWGKCLYVDDLVTAEDLRSRGAGTAMISWLTQYARQQGCRELHLDSGNHRKDAHRFYIREGLKQDSLHFSIANIGD